MSYGLKSSGCECPDYRTLKTIYAVSVRRKTPAELCSEYAMMNDILFGAGKTLLQANIAAMMPERTMILPSMTV